MFNSDETIAAIASPPGDALRGIVRLSGLASRFVFEQLMPDIQWPKQAERLLANIDLGSTLGRVPASVLIWPDDRSYTGMPSAEIQLPGASPILDAALSKVLASGARLAQPGEFTMRAFLAGRLDLTEAEAVLGVIDAEDRKSLDTALHQMAGGLAKPLSNLRRDLLNLLAHLEAGLDFADEDIEFISQHDLLAGVGRIAAEIQKARDQMLLRDHSTTTPFVVLRGEPNAGKSSLINVLSENQTAIVSQQAGTTRDWIEAEVCFDGLNVKLIDTAGVESTASDIDGLAQRYGDNVTARASVELFCIDLQKRTLSDWENACLAEPLENRVVVGTKSDLQNALATFSTNGWVITSASTGSGLDALKRCILLQIQSTLAIESATVSGTAARCRDILDDASESLQRAHQLIATSAGEELVAAELRMGLDAVGRVTGEVYTDDILDRIFSEFCIGK